MAKKKSLQIWPIVLSSGLVVAIFTFTSDKAWNYLHHHKVGPSYVDSSIRCEEGRILLLVRNNSDEPLDLVSARVNINSPELTSIDALGAYPDISKVYRVTSSESTKLQRLGTSLIVDMKIAQAIPPKGLDHFGFELIGPIGSVDLKKANLWAEFWDIKGNHYRAVN